MGTEGNSSGRDCGQVFGIGCSPCQRRVDLQVPSSYVYRGSGVLRWFDAGTLNMSFPYPYEERSCKK
ncbi:hypothetical protein NECAME_14505 [Necator americanus]|uniref:Uncharacterized protein n=1 Tax=Necator americanus TaxID=51031 RepID=W2SME0_NECAM|nr:hypothetical protein NECAME_14505 [Necator americanus]ETN70839.1 hypothetical protein NECAME_14505 [Necator americanus]